MYHVYHRCYPVQIFTAFVERYTVSTAYPFSADDGGGNECDNAACSRLPPVNFRRYRSRGPLLSWAGFEAVCHHFAIAKSDSGSNEISNRGVNKVPLTHHHQDARRAPTDTSIHRPQEGELAALAIVTAEDVWLTEVQIMVVFLCACTHGSVVASFPDHTSAATMAAAERCSEDVDGRRRHDEEEEYWKAGLSVCTSGRIIPKVDSGRYCRKKIYDLHREVARSTKMLGINILQVHSHSFASALTFCPPLQSLF